MQLKNQTAIVTGGGSGLGRAMVLGLAQEGVKVLIGDVRKPEGEKVLDEIRSCGGTGELFVGDISQEATAKELIHTCLQRFSGLDILINNAGLRMEDHDDGVYEPWRCLKKQPTHELPIEEWDLVIRINLRAPYLCTHFALPHMIKQKRGTIISTSSGAGSRGVAGKSAYCASKHGIEGFMKTVAEEMLPYGISANSIHPGRGRANVDGRGGSDPQAMVPLVRALCSQDGPKITGQSLTAMDWNEEKARQQ
ncbi:MAG: SDR family NAD(P)-dependent oxidoreductase [Deltaproteobacteria bacterium]|nr:SDR family NAD(P)-dependent oxidoreductase [Deltaproteobacteria bacterium]